MKKTREKAEADGKNTHFAFEDNFDPKKAYPYKKDNPYHDDTDRYKHDIKPVYNFKRIEEMEELIEDNPMVVMNFSASWCPPCKEIAPQYD